jgi:alpha-tubulin suppressor-like RCC1 family protein
MAKQSEFKAGQIYVGPTGKHVQITMIRNGKTWARVRNGNRGPYGKTAVEVGSEVLPNLDGFRLREPAEAATA